MRRIRLLREKPGKRPWVASPLGTPNHSPTFSGRSVAEAGSDSTARGWFSPCCRARSTCPFGAILTRSCRGQSRPSPDRQREAKASPGNNQAHKLKPRLGRSGTDGGCSRLLCHGDVLGSPLPTGLEEGLAGIPISTGLFFAPILPLCFIHVSGLNALPHPPHFPRPHSGHRPKHPRNDFNVPHLMLNWGPVRWPGVTPHGPGRAFRLPSQAVEDLGGKPPSRHPRAEMPPPSSPPDANGPMPLNAP